MAELLSEATVSLRPRIELAWLQLRQQQPIYSLKKKTRLWKLIHLAVEQLCRPGRRRPSSQRPSRPGIGGFPARPASHSWTGPVPDLASPSAGILSRSWPPPKPLASRKGSQQDGEAQCNTWHPGEKDGAGQEPPTLRLTNPPSIAPPTLRRIPSSHYTIEKRQRWGKGGGLRQSQSKPSGHTRQQLPSEWLLHPFPVSGLHRGKIEKNHLKFLCSVLIQRHSIASLCDCWFAHPCISCLHLHFPPSGL